MIADGGFWKHVPPDQPLEGWVAIGDEARAILAQEIARRSDELRRDFDRKMGMDYDWYDDDEGWHRGTTSWRVWLHGAIFGAIIEAGLIMVVVGLLWWLG